MILSRILDLPSLLKKNRFSFLDLARAEEKICERYILISHDPIQRRYGNCEAMYWQNFLNELWNDKIL